MAIVCVEIKVETIRQIKYICCFFLFRKRSEFEQFSKL